MQSRQTPAPGPHLHDLSEEAVMRRVPCGLKATLEISPSCPTSVCWHTPVSVWYSLGAAGVGGGSSSGSFTGQACDYPHGMECTAACIEAAGHGIRHCATEDSVMLGS